MDTNKIFESKVLQVIIISIAGLIVLAFVFGLGVSVGIKKADFSFRWADQYHKNFGGPQGGFLGDIRGREFMDANGVFGQILKIDGQTITISGRNNVEKNILVGEKTKIVYQRDNIKLSELKVGDSVVVIGEPNDKGQIQAGLIRIMPPPPQNNE